MHMVCLNNEVQSRSNCVRRIMRKDGTFIKAVANISIMVAVNQEMLARQMTSTELTHI